MAVIPRESGYPVRRGLTDQSPTLWNTGSPAFARDDIGANGNQPKPDVPLWLAFEPSRKSRLLMKAAERGPVPTRHVLLQCRLESL